MIKQYATEITGTVDKLLTTDQIIELFAAVLGASTFEFSELEEFTEVCATGARDEMLMMQFTYDNEDFEEAVLACNRFLITGTTEITIEDCSDPLTLDLLALDTKLQEALSTMPTGTQSL